MWNQHQNKKQQYTHFKLRSKLFQVLFFFSTLNDWHNSYLNIRNSESTSIFKTKLLPFIRPLQTNIYNIFDPKGLKFLTRLRLGLSYLNEQRFRHNFQDCLNPSCSCSLETKETSHYLLQCYLFHTVVLFLWIVQNPFVIILMLCLAMSKKIYFFMVTHDLMKTKIKLFWRQLWII